MIGDNIPSLTGSNAWYNYSGSFSIADRFAFIPTASALDIGAGDANIGTAEYFTPYIATAPPSSPLNTPFDNFFTAFTTNNLPANNELHTSITARNATFAGNELAGTPQTYTCSNACPDKEITGSSAVCVNSSGTFEIAFSSYGTDYVSWSVSPSISGTISSSGNTCAIYNNGGDEDTFILTATVHTACGNVTFSKEFDMGVATFLLTPTCMNSACTQQRVLLNPDCANGINSVVWGGDPLASGTQTFPYVNGNCWYNGRTYTSTLPAPLTITATVNTVCGTQYLSRANYAAAPNEGLAYVEPENKKIQLGENITITPNPTTSNWHLNIPYGIAASYQLFDMTGRLAIGAISCRQGINAIDAHNLTNGNYLLKVTTQSGVQTLKLNKN
ncbi:MAG: T9SS type A sorting domain-containing protein [Edaphocola sp.]